LNALRPKYVGARVARKEDRRLLKGQGHFVDDLHPPGTVHLAFVRSPHAHARIGEIRTGAAACAPRVVAVIRSVDLRDSVRVLRAASRMADYHATAFFPLAEGLVRYVGEPICAVVADDRHHAEDAAERIEVEYEPLAAVSDPWKALEGGPLLHEAAGTNVLVQRTFARGDPDRVLSQAAHRIHASFRFHRKAPSPIENRAVLASYDPAVELLTVYTSSQVPGLIRDALCEALDMPGHSLRVVAPDVGGGFGAKASLYPEEVVAAALSRQLERPVKWTGDRLEDLLSTSQAFDEWVEAELGIGEDGRLLALRAEALGDVGAYSIYPWTAALEPVQVVSFLPGPYRLEHYRASVRGVATCKAPTGPYRGVGRPCAVFVMERLLDMAARRLGVDPLALRQRNLVSAAEFPYRAASGLQWDGAGFQECLTRASQRFGYEAAVELRESARAEGRWVGIGSACYAELTGIGSRISAAPGMPINTGTETAIVRIDATGSITAVFGVASHGQGLETSLAQVVAEELGARPDQVRVVQGDSGALAHGTGTYASRSAVLAGGAGTLAARKVRSALAELAAHVFESDPHDVEIDDGEARVAGTDRRITFQELARAFYSEMGRFPKVLRERLSLEATETYDPYFGTTSCATHLALVEVDRGTFSVKVLRYTVVEDCGRIINPMIVDGQVHGGVGQGIGAALLEEVVYDRDGQCLSGSFVDYLLPTAVEVSAIDVDHVESVSPSTLNGFRGMGEGGTIGAPAAVASALSDALSPLAVEVNELPATPERLFRLVEAANTRPAGMRCPTAGDLEKPGKDEEVANGQADRPAP